MAEKVVVILKRFEKKDLKTKLGFQKDPRKRNILYTRKKLIGSGYKQLGMPKDVTRVTAEKAAQKYPDKEVMSEDQFKHHMGLYTREKPSEKDIKKFNKIIKKQETKFKKSEIIHESEVIFKDTVDTFKRKYGTYIIAAVLIVSGLLYFN